ncbi:response regulator [Micromonospora sp. STR1s_5]|nr:response regulator [Micromonospora sp. STR1s_5]
MGVLADCGYRVVVAPDAPAALKMLDAEPDVDLLFTDVVLPPGMNGRELADEASRRRPGLKVLFTTGYSRNAIVHNGRLDPGVNLIGKPFTQPSLPPKYDICSTALRKATARTLTLDSAVRPERRGLGRVFSSLYRRARYRGPVQPNRDRRRGGSQRARELR